MAATWRILTNHNLKRCVCTTSSYFGKYAKREGRFMRKMLFSETGKRKWYENKERPAITATPEKLTSAHAARRMNVLNKLFMQHITELMSTGEVSSELFGRGIEISHVKVTPDYHHVLVYWFTKQENQLTETEKTLNNCSYRLRHELTQLRVIGQVPLIKFVKDRQVALQNELDKRFRLADYGEDHEPTVNNFFVKNELTLRTKLPLEVREKILHQEDRKLLQIEENDESIFDVDLPPMRHDAMSVDHHAIMTKVKRSLSKSREGANNRHATMVTINPIETGFSMGSLDLQNTEDNAKAFTEFLVKRRLEDKRRTRREKRESSFSFNESLQDEYEDEDELLPDDKDVDLLEDISLDSIKQFEHL